MSYNGGKKETNLVASTTFDFVRVIKDQASRRITLTNFVAAIKQALIDIGFLTSDDLPVTVSQRRAYKEVNSNYGLTTSESVLGVDTSGSDVTINLMLASTVFDATGSTGQVFLIKNVTSDSNKVTISAPGGDLIEGNAFIELDGIDFPFVSIMPNSLTTWIILY